MLQQKKKEETGLIIKLITIKECGFIVSIIGLILYMISKRHINIQHKNIKSGFFKPLFILVNL
mgnify:CR=1 FL=1